MAAWPRPWLRRVGGFPSCYFALDLETSGFRKDDVVVAVSHYQVRDGAIEHPFYALVDYSDTEIQPNFLRRRLGEVRDNLYGYTVTYERMCDEGLPAAELFGCLYEIYRTLMGKGYFAAAHNGCRFDEPRLAGHMRWLTGADDFAFGNQILDTQAWEVALRSEENDAKLEFLRTDTIRDWTLRAIGQSNKHKKLRLDDLVELYGHAVDFERLHDADVGAYAVHLVVEEHRKRCLTKDDPLNPLQWGMEKLTLAGMVDDDLPPVLPPVPQPKVITAVKVPLRRRGQRNR